MEMAKGLYVADLAKRQHRGLSYLIFAPGRSLLLVFDFTVNIVVFSVAMEFAPRIAVVAQHASLLFIATVFATFFALFGLGAGYYERSRRFVLSNIGVVGFAVGLAATIASLAAHYFIYYSVIGRLSLLYGFFSSFLVLFVSRLFCRRYLLSHPYGFCVVDNSPHLDDFKRLGSSRRRDRDLFRFVGVDLRAEESAQEWLSKLLAADVGVVVMTRSAVDSKPQFLDLIGELYSYGIRVVDEIDFFAQTFERLPIDVISRNWILNNGLDPRRYFTDTAKRAIDVVMSAAALTLASPIFLLIALCIKLSSPGPILFMQPRMGRFGRPFFMHKFRTMHDADCRTTAEEGFTRLNDHRVTRIGRLIRPLHFDELPQLWNILRGDMSLVGSRPEALPFARQMQKRLELYEFRYLMRPGLTGHAQIMQGYAMDTVEDTKHKLSFDLYYLVNHSLLLDIRIILRTLFVFAKKAR